MNTDSDSAGIGGHGVRRPPAPTRLLVALAIVLAVMEALPLVVMWLCQGIWPLKNFEDFSYAFWPSLKVAYVPSYYFNHGGFYFEAVMKLVHVLTDYAVGSKDVSYRNLQFFGYTARIVFGVATLGVVAVYWRRRRDTVSVLITTALLLIFRLATPWITGMYHLRVGLQLSYIVFILLLALATMEAMDRFLDGETPTIGCFVYWGILSGATLLEAPHFVPFFLPLFAVGVIRPGSIGAIGARLLQWGGGALLGAVIGLVGFYGFDYRSAAAATFSQIKGIVVGFPQPQPGFEQFPNLIFDPRNDYFLIKVVLAIQVLVVVGFGIAWALTWPRQNRRSRYAALVIAVSFVLIWLVHLHVWKTHGSYTTVFSLVYFGFLTIALIFQNGCRAWEIGNRSKMTGGTIALAAAGFLIPCGTTLWCFPYNATVSYDRAEGASFRSFNAFLDRFPKPIGLVFNPDISYFPLVAHCDVAVIMHHIGSSVGPVDARFSEQIQKDRFPDYRLIHDYRVIAADYDFGDAHLHVVEKKGWPKSSTPTVLVPIAETVGNKYGPMLAMEIHTVPVDEIPPGQDVVRFLTQHPQWGLDREDFGGLRWSLMPLLDPEIRDTILKDRWPERWSRRQRVYYLVSTHLGFYLLGLSLSGHSGDIDEPGEMQVVPARPGGQSAHASSKAGYGPLDLRVKFPGNRWNVAEPIVTTGIEKAGDFLYVIYSDPGHIRIGFDHWFEGGPVTARIPIDYSREHRLEISLGSLFPPADDGAFAGRRLDAILALKQTLSVKLDGKTVIEAPAEFYYSTPDQITVGKNLINGSTCNPSFTGSILGKTQKWPE